MIEIYIFDEESYIPAKIERLFGTHGPHTLEGRRLDLLKDVQILANSSTSITNQIGASKSQVKTGSMLGRAAAGGVLLGGTGALAGAVTARREEQNEASSVETLNTELTAELSFIDGTSLYVLLKSIESLHWLLSYVGKKSLTNEDLKLEKELAIEQEKKEEEDARKKRLINVQIKLDKEKSSRNKVILWILIILFIFIFPSAIIPLMFFGIFLTVTPKKYLLISVIVFIAFAAILDTNNNIDTNSTKQKIITQPISSEIKINKKVINVKSKTKKILALLKKIPVSEYNRNLDLYTKLVAYNPNVALYQKKVAFYAAKIKRKENETIKKRVSFHTSKSASNLRKATNYMNDSCSKYITKECLEFIMLAEKSRAEIIDTGHRKKYAVELTEYEKLTK